jgi:hypothetical protein
MLAALVAVLLLLPARAHAQCTQDACERDFVCESNACVPGMSPAPEGILGGRDNDPESDKGAATQLLAGLLVNPRERSARRDWRKARARARDARAQRGVGRREPPAASRPLIKSDVRGEYA